MVMVRIGFIVLLVLGTLAQAQEKRALLVGINDYTHGPAEWDLRGCENDVHMTREMLVTKFGFPQDNVKVLLSGQATAQNIIQGIEDWLINGTKPGDIVYFHFSGHGTQIADQDGDEEDGKDEMLCPADIQWGQAHTYITDDQLKVLLDRIPARHITVVLDACHSGTGTRDVSLSRPRFIDLQKGTRGLAAVNPSPDDVVDATSMESGDRLRVSIFGCRPDQTAADAWIRDDFYAGALTYNLIQNIKKATADISYRQLMDRVVRDMAGTYNQTPQIEGHTAGQILAPATNGVVAKPFAVVQAVQEDKIRLNVGRAHGVEVGSVYAVFRAGETRFDGSGLARIEIVWVGQTRAEAKVLEGGPIEPGYRIKEVLHKIADDGLKILLEVEHDAGRRVLRQGLGAVEFVTVVAEGQHFDVRLRVSVELGVYRAVLVFDGAPGEETTGGNVDELLSALHPQLGNAYVIKRLAALDNPAPDFGVAVWGNRVDVDSPLGSAPDQRYVRAQVGDVIRFNFKAERDCYLSLINVGTSGKVTVLFPNEYRPDGWIQGGKVYQTGTEGEMPFRIRAGGPAGRELVKVIATLEPLDFASLKMGVAAGAGTRSIAAGTDFAGELSRDLAAVWVEEAVGGDVEEGLLPTQGWATDYLIVDTR